MKLNETIPALVWQSDIEALGALIDSRHAKLTADFNRHVISDETMTLCVCIQQHVNALWVRQECGLLGRRGNHR